MSRRNRNPNAPTRKQIREKHKKKCAAGEHSWRPTFVSERLGSTPKWDGSVIHCEYCSEHSTLDTLGAFDESLVTRVAKILADGYEKVAQLHPTRTFSDSGI